ncbi:MAG: hypothetical protein ACPGUV_03240 [Polyangiales bacterium]
MRAREYRASNMEEALAQARRELGPDAVIVSTQRLPASHSTGSHVTVQATAAPGNQTLQLEAQNKRVLKWLARAGVPAASAQLLMAALKRELGPVLPSPRALQAPLLRVLARELLFAHDSTGPHAAAAALQRSARVMALVGPTGAGKTTTAAKIAAEAALVQGKRTALICMDDYRVGGAEQLERYADLIGIPMQVAPDSATLQHALSRFRAADLILIDTAGRSPRDKDALPQLRRTFDGADVPIQVHLCVPAALPLRELNMLVERHACLGAGRIIATKLDEATYHGGIIAVQAATGLPLSFFTTGQRVPEDIEAATAQRLAALLCGEELEP